MMTMRMVTVTVLISGWVGCQAADSTSNAVTDSSDSVAADNTTGGNTVSSATATNETTASSERITLVPDDQIPQTEAEWKERLTAEQFKVLRKQGTERAHTGEYADSKQPGTYHCAGCGEPLFDAETKFDSGTGWPSFYDVIGDVGEHVETREDRSLFSVRTEVHCKRCQGHLGHVFDDGPAPTGLRYCMNSAALKLAPKETQDKKPQDASPAE